MTGRASSARLGPPFALGLLLALGACTPDPEQAGVPAAPPPQVPALVARDTDGDGRPDRVAWRGDDALFDALDADGDGRVSVAELASGFAAFDRDGDGRLGTDEVEAPALDTDGDGAIARAEWRADLLMAALDRDGDGALVLDELRGPAARRPAGTETGSGIAPSGVAPQHGRGVTVFRF